VIVGSSGRPLPLAPLGDVVVHAAALHGIQLDEYTTEVFWNPNVAGTRNVYETARKVLVSKSLSGERTSRDPREPRPEIKVRVCTRIPTTWIRSFGAPA
jgi:nucleoside-diphosphate-sugar epimerase